MSNISVYDDMDYGLGYILLFRLIVWGYIGMVLSLFGIVGNIITIFVLISPSMRTTSTNMYLIALSCSNILFLLIFIPTYSIKYLLGYSVYMSNEPPFGFEILLTRLPTTPIYNTILLSIIYLTIAVSMDRLILLKLPLKAKNILTKRSTLITILLIYIFSIIYCIPYWLEQRYIPELKRCRLTKIGRKIYKYTRIYIYIPVVYVIPFVTLTCINITIILILIAKKRHRLSLCAKTTKKKNADYHITLMLVIIIIVFVLSELPLLILNVWYAIDPRDLEESLKFHTLNSIGVLLIVLNTSTNFLLYCFFGQKFRQTLVKSIVNIFSNHSKKSNLQTLTLRQKKLPLQIQSQQQQQKDILRTSTTTTTIPDSKLIKIKSNEQNQLTLVNLSLSSERIPILSNKEDLHPLLTFTTIQNKHLNEQFIPIEEISQTDSTKHSYINEKQLLVVKI